MVLQDGVLSVLMLDSALVLPQALSEGVHFSANEWVFCPIVLYRPALDRTMVQSCILVRLESDVIAIE